MKKWRWKAISKEEEVFLGSKRGEGDEKAYSYSSDYVLFIILPLLVIDE